MKLKIRPWVKIVFSIIIIFTLLILYSRYIGTKGIITHEYNIINSKIPSNMYGLKIVQISDIHYKVTTDKKDLKKIIKEINLHKPDIVLFTGDLFDSNIKYTKKDFEDINELLKSIDSNIDKYIIKGEDDLKIDSFESIIEESGFINLNDSYDLIYYNGLEPILLVGISSNYKDNHIKETLDNIYKDINEEYNYSILMLHEPDFIKEIDYNKFNLILAGHSHNGQIKLPFMDNIIKQKYSTKYYGTYYDLDNTKLYISNGIGTSKYKFRFLNKPSISLFRLRNK